MPSPRFEVPSGIIDGSNTVFTVSRAYQPGSTAVFLNGALREKSLDNGWVETDSSAGEVTLKQAPLNTPGTPDILQIFFIDTSAALPETEITKIKGRIRPRRVLRGRLTDPIRMQGHVRPSPALSGRLVSPVPIAGAVRDRQKIKAVIRESCLWRS